MGGFRLFFFFFEKTDFFEQFNSYFWLLKTSVPGLKPAKL